MNPYSLTMLSTTLLYMIFFYSVVVTPVVILHQGKELACSTFIKKKDCRKLTTPLSAQIGSDKLKVGSDKT